MPLPPVSCVRLADPKGSLPTRAAHKDAAFAYVEAKLGPGRYPLDAGQSLKANADTVVEVRKGFLEVARGGQTSLVLDDVAPTLEERTVEPLLHKPLDVPCQVLSIAGGQQIKSQDATHLLREELTDLRRLRSGEHSLLFTEQTLNAGAFGWILPALDSRRPEELRVLKVEPRYRRVERGWVDGLPDVQQEAVMAKLANSPAAPIALYFTETETFLVERAFDTDLYQALRALHAKPLKERAALARNVTVDMLRQMLAQLASLHAAGCMHRDVKPENIFASAGLSPSQQHCLALADFGLARHVDNRQSQLLGGTAGYLAPETLQRWLAPSHPRSAVQLDQKVDCWSLGVAAWQLLTGRNPFDPLGGELGKVSVLHDSWRRFVKRHESGMSFTDIEWVATEEACDAQAHFACVLSRQEPEVAQMLLGLMHYDPTRRWSAAEALTHACNKIGLDMIERRTVRSFWETQRRVSDVVKVVKKEAAFMGAINASRDVRWAPQS